MINKTYTADDTANWYLSRNSMSRQKLQKMVYYAYAWVLTVNNEDVAHLNNRLFSESIMAWVHGPAIPTLSRQYREFGDNVIPLQEDRVYFPSEISEVLQEVQDIYGHLSEDQFESIAHEEDPWLLARRGLTPADTGHAIISDESIFNYYVQQAEVY
ncbi:Panacea domain-containing protein [Secundilactobacillus paracollinoides]|uniref:Panacea domain-containing protein n=1 Tax=Secundilactobacillus paracollinoides TaxID=240427 RepID=UPI000B12FAD5|nr:type II toxin-antitoxin system antitoxin SocA domain-containing protein [Secundilactobacillus paracollinoides]